MTDRCFDSEDLFTDEDEYQEDEQSVIVQGDDEKVPPLEDSDDDDDSAKKTEKPDYGDSTHWSKHLLANFPTARDLDHIPGLCENV